jgi:hypothetical protein
VSQASKKVMTYAVENADQYPENLTEVGIQSTADTTYQYLANNSTNPRSYCLTVMKGDISYYVSGSNSTVTQGICSTNSIIVWNKFDPATRPLTAGVLNSSVYRQTPPSVELGPGIGAGYRGNKIGRAHV